jgi:hypothetical protein
MLLSSTRKWNAKGVTPIEHTASNEPGRVQKRALQHGLAVRIHKGGYMIVDQYGAALAGEGFTLTLHDVDQFLQEWNIKQVNEGMQEC